MTFGTRYSEERRPLWSQLALSVRIRFLDSQGQVKQWLAMDLRLSEALGTTPGYWLALQAERDLWTVRRTTKDRKRIKRTAEIELETA